MMKKVFTFFLMCLCTLLSTAQVSYETFDSRKLNSTRKIKVKLPKNYDENSALKHPLVIVFDGDYLFEPVAGQIDFQTYLDEMPSSIVVGVMHEDVKFYDTYVDEVSGLPREFGAKFYEFIGSELIPYLDNKYKTSKFRVAVGHDQTANFINSFLMKDAPLFQAYVNISPDYVGQMGSNVASRLEWAKNDIIYYLATAQDDISHIKDQVQITDAKLKEIKNPNVTYYYDYFDEATHYTMATRAISRAFDKIFDLYKPISEKELREKVLTYDGTLDQYIKARYDKIQDLFGIYKSISEDEFGKVVAIADERKDSKSLEKIGKLANQRHPNSLLGTYYLALHAEKEGKTKRAVKLYQSALMLDDSTIIDRDFILSRVEDLKVAETDVDTEEDPDGND